MNFEINLSDSGIALFCAFCFCNAQLIKKNTILDTEWFKNIPWDV